MVTGTLQVAIGATVFSVHRKIQTTYFFIVETLPTEGGAHLNHKSAATYAFIRRFLVHSDTEYRPTEHPVSHLAEFRPIHAIVNRVVARQFTDWQATNAQFSPNEMQAVLAQIAFKRHMRILCIFLSPFLAEISIF